MKDIIPTPEPLKYSEASDFNQVSCASHLEKYGINVGALDKVQSKVMAHLFPTQVMNVDTGTTDMQPACTLPQQLLPSYAINPISCGLTNDAMHPAFGDMNVMKGCVMKTADPNGFFTRGNTYPDATKVRGFLDNAAVALDGDSQRYIEFMRGEKKKLQDRLASIQQQRQEIRDVIAPIKTAYHREMTTCENEIKQHNQRKNSTNSSIRPESIVPKQSDIEKHMEELESLHASFKEKILRNIREISFVSSFSIASQGWVGSKLISDLDFIKEATPSDKQSFSKPINLSVSDVYDETKLAKIGTDVIKVNETFKVNWDNKTRTILIPPGMKARFYEHPEFKGGATQWIGAPHNPVVIPTHNNLFPSGWDKLVSSMEISGVFSHMPPNIERYVQNVITYARRMIRDLPKEE